MRKRLVVTESDPNCSIIRINGPIVPHKAPAVNSSNEPFISRFCIKFYSPCLTLLHIYEKFCFPSSSGFNEYTCNIYRYTDYMETIERKEDRMYNTIIRFSNKSRGFIMDKRHLDTLIAAVRTGSFSKASEELHCTQSAVTQSINALENELNCKLLIRSHKGIVLSETGELLYPFVLEAEKSLALLQKQAIRLSAKKKRPLRIGAFSSIANTWLPKMIQRYQEIHADVEFDIRISTDQLSAWLANGMIDIALGDSDRLKGFRFQPVMEDIFYAVVPVCFSFDRQQTVAQDELAEFPFIMAPMNELDRQLKCKPKRQVRVDCDDDYTLLSMVEQGLGATVMPGLSLAGLHHEVSIHTLAPKVSRILGVALPNVILPEVQQFADFLKDNVANCAQKSNPFRSIE